jgi:hypothetical protein
VGTVCHYVTLDQGDTDKIIEVNRRKIPHSTILTWSYTTLCLCHEMYNFLISFFRRTSELNRCSAYMLLELSVSRASIPQRGAMSRLDESEPMKTGMAVNISAYFVEDTVRAA